ncbi:MAG: PilZ domain-containing protein [Burkholderiales bacterium]|nr:PilZ domain-containing protein [Burkholderiales bacterium]
MQKLNKTKLIEQLLALFDEEQVSASAADQADLRLRIGRAIDIAMANTQEVDSRRVTILLSDLRGFTSVAERHSALEMVAALNRYFERMIEIIVRHGGTIDKFMGDAIMVLFGAPVAREDHVEQALACAIEMQMAMDDINRQNKTHGMAALYMGIGINSGEVVAGHLGSALHSEYTVIGNQVNLASRVAAHSLRGQILLSENTYLLARDFIETGDINEVKVKGKKGSVRIYELRSITKPRSLTAPRRELRKSPRVDIVDMPLKFQLLSGNSVLQQEHLGQIVDISYGGMRIASPVPIEPFCDIKIALSLSMPGSDLSEIYAKVLRVSPAGASYECSVEFTYIDAKASLAIKGFVDSMVEANRC